MKYNIRKYLISCGSLLAGLILLFPGMACAADVKLAWDASIPTPDGYRVYYGTSSGNYTSNVVVAGSVTTATVPSLNSSTKYYFVVKSYTGAVESSASNEVHTLVVSSVVASSITSTGATISWRTDESSDSQVKYGTTSSYGALSTLNASLVTQHSVTLSGLLPATLYHFKVASQDNLGDGSLSDDYTFTTAAAGDVTPPVISGVNASSLTSVSAVIGWTTNEASDSQVEYGTTTSYGSSTTLNSSMVTSHSVALSGLTGGTLYHYRAKSKDASGNPATSADTTFNTRLPAPPNPKIN
jgi:hypothetical protein